MRTRLVVGNWKMHGSMASSLELVTALKAGLGAVPKEVDVAIAPTFLHTAAVADRCAGTRLAIAAQNVSEHASGAFTGEIACSMLADLGVRFVIVGHSERRALFAESDAMVAAKVAAVSAGGMTPILCVGENLQQRQAGHTAQVVLEQLNEVIDRVGIATVQKAVIAYEPVWAIGTGKAASPVEAQEVHALLRVELAARNGGKPAESRILYGGSIKASNSAALFAQPDIDGGLVGGASLEAREFLSICMHAGK